MSRFLGLVVVLWTCSSGAAATLEQLSLTQMTRAATSIVRAQVTGSSASLTGSTIYTHYQLQVLETWKGATPIEAMLPGGVAGGMRQAYPGVPSLQIGSQYVLFLWKSSKTGITHIVGLNQGIYTIRGQGSTAQANRPAIAETILDSSGRVVQAPAVQMPLADLKTQVIQTLTPGAAQ